MPTGTVPNNYPPSTNMNIGDILTGSSIGNTAALATAIFFTAPVAGLYMIAAAVRVVTTNGAGTLALTIGTPNAGTITENTPVLLTPAAAIVRNPVLATPANGFMAGVPIWMNQGQTITGAVAVTGLTGTTYDVYVTAQKLL